jgi:hypothetical protein
MFTSSLFADETPAWIAIGGWVAAAIVPVVQWLLTRKRGHYLTVTRLRSVSLIDLPPDFKKRTNVTFDGEPVASLSSLLLEAVNSCTESLKNAAISISLGSKTRVLGVDVTGTEASAKFSDCQTIHIEIPLLNSHRLHGERVEIKIICDGQVDEVRVAGRGDDWSVNYQSNSAFLRWAVRVAMVFAAFSWLCLIGLIYECTTEGATTTNLTILGFSVSNALIATWMYLGGRRAMKRMTTRPLRSTGL